MSIFFDKDAHVHSEGPHFPSRPLNGHIPDRLGNGGFHEAPIEPSAGESRFARNAGVVSGATLLSRVLGALRDVMIASAFGAGMVSDAFIAAFRVPEFMRRLFGEGSLSIAFVPVYADHLYREGRPAADQLAMSALRLLTLVLLLVTGAGVWAAPWLVKVVAPGFAESADKYLLTVTLARTMFPYLLFIGLVALCMSILNVLGHFAAPAASPALLNVAMIAALLLGIGFAGDTMEMAMWLAVGVVVGGASQLGLQIPFLIRNQVRFKQRAPLWHPCLKRVLVLMGPVLFGAAVFQINSLVITLLGSFLPQGSVSYLYYADRLVQLPLGVFGASMATAVLPVLSRQAAAGQSDAMRQTFNKAMRMIFFISFPAMAGLIVLRGPIVSLLFQRGAFDALSMQLTAGALLYYAMGLWAFCAVRIVLSVFYALQDTRTPVQMAVLSILANLAAAFSLMGPMAHHGLALALSFSSTLNFVLLLIALRPKLGVLGGRRIAVSAVKSAFCATIMGVCVQGLALWWVPSGTTSGTAFLPGLTACILTGTMLYGLLAHVMGIPEMQSVTQFVGERFRRR